MDEMDFDDGFCLNAFLFFPFTNCAFFFSSVVTDTKNATSDNYSTRRLAINFGTFPNHMMLTVWVVAHNELGTVKSDELTVDSEQFGM